MIYHLFKNEPRGWLSGLSIKPVAGFHLVTRYGWCSGGVCPSWGQALDYEQHHWYVECDEFRALHCYQSYQLLFGVSSFFSISNCLLFVWFLVDL